MNMTLHDWAAPQAADLLTEATAEDHKYSRGVLGVRTGSSRYPGAAVLTTEAAWRAGIGMVQFTPALADETPAFGLPTPAAAVLAQRPETVFTAGDPAYQSRCDAWLVGSGTDASLFSDTERAALFELMRGRAPVVVDAGALSLVPLAAPHERRAPLILTPHRGEFARLWRAAGLPDSAAHSHAATRAKTQTAAQTQTQTATARARATADATDAVRLAHHLGVTVLLKGSITIAAAPGHEALKVGPATPMLATAGTGDVLAGLLGSLVAAHADRVQQDSSLLAKLGATAAVVHDVAARLASQPTDGSAARPIVALDVAAAIPAAVALVREGRSGPYAS